MMMMESYLMSYPVHNSRIYRRNIYQFEDILINKHFEGDLSFVNDFTHPGNDISVAVFKNKAPNKKKGHKPYMGLLADHFGKWYVTGFEHKELRPVARVAAIDCLKCNMIIYSVTRHDFHHCKCQNAFVDGGRDYFRYGAKVLSKTRIIELDLFTGHIKATLGQP